MSCWLSYFLNNFYFVYLQVDPEPSDEAALILHRKGFDCRFSNRDLGLLCSTTQGKVYWHFMGSLLCKYSRNTDI